MSVLSRYFGIKSLQIVESRKLTKTVCIHLYICTSVHVFLLGKSLLLHGLDDSYQNIGVITLLRSVYSYLQLHLSVTP